MKVLVADPQWVFRLGLKQLLGKLDEGAETLEAQDLAEALKVVARNPDIDLVLVDHLMPGMEDFDGLEQLRDRLKGRPIVVMSDVDGQTTALRAIEKGALGFLYRTATGDEILKGLQLVLAGGMYMSREPTGQGRKPAARHRGPRLEATADMSKLQSLTRRQREVLQLLGQGRTNMDIADTMDLSERTVRIHVSAILKALGLRNRTQAALIAAGYRDVEEFEGSRRPRQDRDEAAAEQT